MTETVVLKPSEKAEIATLKVTLRAIEKGAFVLRPVQEGLRYDIALDYQGRLYRVQVKYCNNPTKNGVAVLHLKSGSYGRVRFKSYHHAGSGFDTGLRGKDRQDSLA